MPNACLHLYFISDIGVGRKSPPKTYIYVYVEINRSCISANASACPGEIEHTFTLYGNMESHSVSVRCVCDLLLHLFYTWPSSTHIFVCTVGGCLCVYLCEIEKIVVPVVHMHQSSVIYTLIYIYAFSKYNSISMWLNHCFPKDLWDIVKLCNSVAWQYISVHLFNLKQSNENSNIVEYSYWNMVKWICSPI